MVGSSVGRCGTATARGCGRWWWVGAVAIGAAGPVWAGGSCEPPTIHESPTSVTMCASGSMVFEVEATGPGALGYQWQVEHSVATGGWADIAEGGPVLCDGDVVGEVMVWADSTGSTTPRLALSTLRHRHASSFVPRAIRVRCVVSNGCEPNAASAAAIGAVCLADTDCNGAIEPSDLATFVNTWLGSLNGGGLAGDFDGNGVIEPSDLAVFVGVWLGAVTAGCQAG
ncbi:MAG: hypothetical protein KF745_05755 [Phycisphaeraceae bacterium]|nr:hypothetical protein [Phycisphaeraceae bacterium]